MDDFSKLSDSDLQALYAKRQQPAAAAVDTSKMSDAELQAAYAEKNPGFWRRVGDQVSDVSKGAYKAIDRGVAEGMAGLLAMPRTISDAQQSLTEMQLKNLEAATGKTLTRPSPSPASRLPSQEDWQKVIQKQYYGDQPGTQNPIDPYEPRNLFEQYLKTGGEFAIGALAPGGPLARTMRVATPAVLSETGGQLTKGTPAEPFMRTAGALVGGGVQGGAEAAVSRPRTARAILERQLPESTTPQHIDAAEALMRDAQTMGVPLTWPEALSQVQQRPVLSDTMRHLEGSPQSGPHMAEFFGDRPQRVAGAVDQQAQALSPGAPTNPYALGPDVHGAASGIINNERQAINARSDPQYAAAGLQFVEPRELMRLQALPGWDEAAQAVRNSSQLGRDVVGMPDSSIGFVNAVKKAMQARGEHATSPMRSTGAPSVEEASGWFSDAEVARQTAINASRRQTAPGVPAPYEEALRIETEGRARRLQPLLQGPLGKIVEAKPDIESAVNVLFPRGGMVHNEAQIGDAVSRIAARSPKLAEDAVRAHVDMAFNTAAGDLQTGPNQAGGAKFRALIAGRGQQRRNLQAAVEALPNGAERWQGFSRLLDVLEATGTRQNVGSRTAYNTEALKEFGSSAGAVQDVAKAITNPISGAKPFIDRYEGWKLGRNLNDVARILTSPQSANLLRQIVTSPRGGVRETNIIRALFANQAMQPAVTAAGKEAQ